MNTCNTDSAHLAELARIARAVTIHSGSAFTFAGRRFDVAPAGREDNAGHRLINQLRDCLYAQAYCHRFNGVWRASHNEHAVSDLVFTATLSAANTSQARLDEGWVVHAALPEGQWAVRKGNLMRTVAAGDFVLEDGAFGVLKRGSPVRLWWPRETTSAQPGFYIAFGEAIPDGQDEHNLVRFYWNLRAAGLAVLIRTLTQSLNDAAIPFQLKCPASAWATTRRDTAVLYVAQAHARVVAGLIAPLLPALQPHLRGGMPLFTRPLGRGLSVAHDSGTGESFGQHRMQLVAEGLWQAHCAGQRTVSRKLAAIHTVFASRHIDLAKPHLNPGVQEDVADAIDAALQVEAGKPATTFIALNPASSFLDTAVQIGRQLCRDAVWWGDQCTWMGDSLEAVQGRLQIVHRACGPDLYAGTSGIALFLAQLHAFTGEPTLRWTAEAALRHALAHVEDVAPTLRNGLYAGWAGVIYATYRSGLLLDSAEVHDQTRALLQRFLAQKGLGGEPDMAVEAEVEMDVISGWAGAIPILLMMHSVWPDLDGLTMARQAGETLLRAAQWHGQSGSWRTPGERSRRNLCGFAHGAAGIAWALLELHHATGEPQFRQMAEGGMNYEREHFNLKRGNWPDFRQRPADNTLAWCHGAPGIGLARLRAHQLTQDPACLDEVSAAIKATQHDLAQHEDAGSRNYSLCHGVGGNADFLLSASALMSQERHDPAALKASAEACGRWGIERYAKRRLPWPCGVDDAGAGHAPGLMLGAAGIGYFYLRLHAPHTVPSVLLPTLRTDNETG